MFALALAVGLTPELLPMIVTVTLARGALRLAGAGVIVKRLPAIHDLGAMDVLCTDKTGTLTEARIRLVRHVDADGTEARACSARLSQQRFETGIRSPLDDAILAHAKPDAGAWTKLDEVPFDFERRRVSVLLPRRGRRAAAHRQGRAGGRAAPAHALGRRRRDTAGRGVARGDRRGVPKLGDDGYRVLGIAYRDVGARAGDRRGRRRGRSRLRRLRRLSRPAEGERLQRRIARSPASASPSRSSPATASR